MRTSTVNNIGYDIPVSTYESDCLDDTKIQRVVMANGFVGGNIAGSFAKRLANVATNRFEISAYQEPRDGTGIYAESYRAEILDKVVRSMGRVHILAHSRGTIAWSEVGPGLMDDELIDGFAGLTPIGLSQLPNLTRSERYHRLGHEAVRPSIDTKDSAVMSARIAGHILRRFSHPLAAINEVDRTLQADTANSIVDTSRTVPTVMITGSRDRLVPSEEVQNRLDENSGYQGKHVEIPATHLDAFANPRHSFAIYGALHDMETIE